MMKYLFAFVLVCVCSSVVLAQVDPIQTGDTLKYKVQLHRQPGVEHPYARTIEVSPDGSRIEKSTDGRLWFFGLHHEVTKNPTNTLLEEKHVRIPQNLFVGQSWTSKFTRPSNDPSNMQCSKVSYNFTANAAEGPQFPVVIDGVPLKIRTIEVTHEGGWTCNNHPLSGRFIESVLFSPDLGHVVVLKQFVPGAKEAYINTLVEVVKKK